MGREPAVEPPDARALFRPLCCRCDFRIYTGLVAVDEGWAHATCLTEEER